MSALTGRGAGNAFRALRLRGVDSRYATGAPACTIILASQTVSAERCRLEAQNCGGDLATLGSWGIANGQMGLFDRSNKLLFALGGNQNRVSGNGTGGIR